MTIKRYYLNSTFGVMSQSEDGPFVRFVDVAAALTERDELKRCLNSVHDEYDRLAKEQEALEARLAEYVRRAREIVTAWDTPMDEHLEPAMAALDKSERLIRDLAGEEK